MDSKPKRIAIIDNHPLFFHVYQTVLQKIESTDGRWSFEIEEAKCYKGALALLNKMEVRAQNLDLVFLDLHISTSGSRSHLKGEDIGLNIRSRFPGTKIMIKADSKNNYQINTILRSIKPEGFLIMKDVDMEVLNPAIIDVLCDPPFYSKSVLKSLYKSKGHKIFLDEWDERLLYEISRGVKMKDLPEILPLTLTAIEKRKQNIKSLFGIAGGDNSQLLKKAREYGFI